MKNREESCIIHSCDFAIVTSYIDGGGYERLKYIHYDKAHERYTWCKQPKGYYRLPDKVDWIKGNGLWDVLRDLYIEKKNRNDDSNVHSRSIFAITVHEICQKYGFYKEEQ